MSAAFEVNGNNNRMKQDWSACLIRVGESKNKAAFVELFNYFAPRLKSYILRMGTTPAFAEEITQEAMLTVWRKAHLFDAKKATASTWIYTLARNQCIDKLRREKIWTTDEFPEEEASPDERDMQEHAVVEDYMKNALQQLPDAQIQVIHLAYYEGKTHAEIAEQLGIPLGSVKSRMRLAFDKLKVIWGTV